MGDVRTPFFGGSEAETLLAALDYLRDSLLRKLDGLPLDTLTDAGVPSGTSLLGLVKHLTFAETAWFQVSMAGRRVDFPANDLEPGDDVESVVATYRLACAESNEIVRSFGDLGRRCPSRFTAPEPQTGRWVAVHMVEETARHAGHADIVRERIDGVVGR